MKTRTAPAAEDKTPWRNETVLRKSTAGAENVGSRRMIRVVTGFIAVALAVSIAIFLYFKIIAYRTPTSAVPVQLEGAVRAGSPEFERLREGIAVAKPVALRRAGALGDIVMELNTAVQNNTGYRIKGLEMRGAMLNAQGIPIVERTLTPIPSQQSVLEQGEALTVRIRLEGIAPETERSEIRVDVTGLLID